ncbi:Serine carboxypeptidase-like 18 [Linum grandiflorum]
MAPETIFYYVFLLLLTWRQAAAAAAATVPQLPGFNGPLPFHLETGYVGVGESEQVQLFYYFVKSENNPEEDPVLLWLTGGPGCSAFSALAYEIGPIYFEVKEYNGSLPSLVLNPNSWTHVASIIFLDMPVGTGFSYATTDEASQSGDFLQIQQADQFFRKWLIEHPEFISNQVYVGGDSFSGLIVPGVVAAMSDGNEEGKTPFINLQGYLLGNAATDFSIETNFEIPYAYGMALIPNELFQSLKRSCGGKYNNPDPSNVACVKSLEAYHKCTNGVNLAQILEPACAFASPKPMEMILYKKRYLKEDFLKLNDQLPTINCRTYGYLLSKYWANDQSVRRALHIREGSIGTWKRCNYGLQYKHQIYRSVDYHLYLSKKGYRSLIYSGDHDMLITYLGTQAWIRSLNFSIVHDWRSWHVDNQVSGYTRTYSNKMTFATVKGGGHTAPEYRPSECFAMFKRWISEKPL